MKSDYTTVFGLRLLQKSLECGLASGTHPQVKEYCLPRSRMSHDDKFTASDLAPKNRLQKRQPKIGRRQRRINRALEPLSFSSNPNDWKQAAKPVNVPSYPNQLKRGYKPKRNDECFCGSGQKFKNCHKDLEKETPRWNVKNEQVEFYNPYEDKWVSLVELDNYLKEIEKS